MSKFKNTGESAHDEQIGRILGIYNLGFLSPVLSGYSASFLQGSFGKSMLSELATKKLVTESRLRRKLTSSELEAYKKDAQIAFSILNKVSGTFNTEYEKLTFLSPVERVCLAFAAACKKHDIKPILLAQKLDVCRDCIAGFVKMNGADCDASALLFRQCASQKGMNVDIVLCDNKPDMQHAVAAILGGNGELIQYVETMNLLSRDDRPEVKEMIATGYVIFDPSDFDSNYIYSQRTHTSYYGPDNYLDFLRVAVEKKVSDAIISNYSLFLKGSPDAQKLQVQFEHDLQKYLSDWQSHETDLWHYMMCAKFCELMCVTFAPIRSEYGRVLEQIYLEGERVFQPYIVRRHVKPKPWGKMYKG